MGKIREITRIFEDAFRELGIDITPERLDACVTAIDEGMSRPGRVFHNHEHIFALCKSSPHPLQRLAALFHDLVYHQIDGGFQREEELLAPYLLETPRGIQVQKGCNRHLHTQLALQIFAMKPGDTLSPVAGLNEFASALVMAEYLHNLVTAEQMATLITCVEATIPFRDDDIGATLEARLSSINKRYSLAIDEVTAVSLAIDLANRDVGNFSETPSSFLSNTWRLLPETNRSLRATTSYSVSDYRDAIRKAAAFFDSLDPSVIYHRYRDTPPKAEYDRICNTARRNIKIAREYLSVKLFTASILEALATESGGNLPMSILMGNPQFHKRPRLEDFLPEPSRSASSLNFEVLKLLDLGRREKTLFDLRNSPLSLFVYQQIGSGGLAGQMQHCHALADGEISARDFLTELPSDVVAPIAQAAAMMADTRKEQLLELAESLADPDSLHGS